MPDSRPTNSPLTTQKFQTIKISSQVNFLIRTVTATLFAALVLFSIQKGGGLMVGLFGLVTVLTSLEFANLTRTYKASRASRTMTASLAGLFYLCIVMQFAMDNRIAPVIAALFLLVLTAALVVELYARKESPIADMVYSIFPVLYVALPMSLLPVLGYSTSISGMERDCYSPAVPLMLFICVWANDVGAYCTGCTIGKHKLFERVSPKKTWEGSIGGAVLTLVAAWALWKIFPEFYSTLPLAVWLGMALVTVVFGTWGDLVESLMKREMGIKDSGKILPGHGGMLDRFDSTLLAIPAVSAYFAVVLTMAK